MALTGWSQLDSPSPLVYLLGTTLTCSTWVNCERWALSLNISSLHRTLLSVLNSSSRLFTSQSKPFPVFSIMDSQHLDQQSPLLNLLMAEDAAPFYNHGSTPQYYFVQGLHSSHQGFNLPIQHGYNIQSVISTPLDQRNTPSNLQSTTENQSDNSRSHNNNSHRSSDSRYIPLCQIQQVNN
jgi:hypothetical protein